MSEINQSLEKVIDAAADGNRGAALDLLNDIMLAKSSEIIDTYKQVVASNVYDELMDNLNLEPETEE